MRLFAQEVQLELKNGRRVLCFGGERVGFDGTEQKDFRATNPYYVRIEGSITPCPEISRETDGRDVPLRVGPRASHPGNFTNLVFAVVPSPMTRASQWPIIHNYL